MNGAYTLTFHEVEGRQMVEVDDVLMLLATFATLAETQGQVAVEAAVTNLAEQIAAGAMS